MSSYQFHCGHSKFEKSGPFARCLTCGSLVDTLHAKTTPEYDMSYPTLRGHFDEAVQRHKITSANGWFKRLGTNLNNKVICEVGFGGGGILLDLARQGLEVFGVEANPANIDHVRQSGLSAEHLYSFEKLPEKLPRPIDLWLFFDSFEHLPNPINFVEWMVSNSASNSAVMLVLPRADCLSRRVLGSLWPHRLPDHTFHWSRSGLVEVFARQNFELRETFFPWKWISLAMVKRHLDHKFKLRANSRLLIDVALPFNIGQQGLIFQRRSPP